LAREGVVQHSGCRPSPRVGRLTVGPACPQLTGLSQLYMNVGHECRPFITLQVTVLSIEEYSVKVRRTPRPHGGPLPCRRGLRLVVTRWPAQAWFEFTTGCLKIN